MVEDELQALAAELSALVKSLAAAATARTGGVPPEMFMPRQKTQKREVVRIRISCAECRTYRVA